MRLELQLPDGSVLACERVADEDYDGAAQRAVLAPGEALAYVSAPRRVGFWTVGFEAPIDRIFVAANGRVAQTLAAREPGERALLGPATDVRVVLEVAAGEARRMGLVPGAVLSGEPFDAHADPGFIAIVQSDRAGWFLACELRRRGYRIAHVHHTHHLDEVGEDQFDVELIYGEDLEAVVPALVELGPCLVLAGSELGVNAADWLAEELGLPGNGTLHSVARRSKAGMIDALRAAGIPVMRQLRARSWKRIARWKERRGLAEIVIKPVRSAGTDRVSSATTSAEVRSAVRAIIGATNRLGLSEVEVVAQERLFGEEIYLNSVSRAGRHAVTEIWRETKRAAHVPEGQPPAPFAYDTFELLPGDDVLARYLTAWLARVLDALGVAWGPAHTELILTPEGPRLIDFGARLDGVLLPGLNEECIGRSPVQLTADAYLDADAWEAWAATPYRLKKHATMVVIDNPRAGVLRDDTGLRELALLPTFHALRPRWAIGEVVPATKDAFSYHSIVTLRDEDAAAVAADYRAIRELEAAGLLLDVTPAAPPAPDEAPPLPGDPRALAAWGRALAPFGWTTLPTDVVARRRDDLDGALVWVPRQPTIDLAALERLRATTDAHRVIVEVLPGARLVPIAGPDVIVGAWSAEAEAALDALGLTPTMHDQAPPILELAPAPDDAPAGVEVRPLGADAGDMFSALGASERWPSALGASFAGEGALAITRAGDEISGAAIGIAHDGVMHVPVAVAHDEADLVLLAQGLGAHAGLPLNAPGTGVSSLPGGRRVQLPPALRWKRPGWAKQLADLDGIRDAIGHAPESPSDPAIVERFAAREHPLATWGGGAIAQALGRAPMCMRSGMLYREPEGTPRHGVVPHAPRIDLGSFQALAERHRLLWIGWEPPPGGGEIIAADGSVHALRWGPGALDEAAALGLYPVRARWTPRKTFVLDLAAAVHDADRIAIRPLAALAASDWRRLDALAGAPLLAARGLALGLGERVVCATTDDAFALCLLHDRVAWSMFGAGPTASRDALRRQLMRHARAAGCDLMDVYGAWDERFPEERKDLERTPPEAAAAVYYPPTLAYFPT